MTPPSTRTLPSLTPPRINVWSSRQARRTPSTRPSPVLTGPLLVSRAVVVAGVTGVVLVALLAAPGGVVAASAPGPDGASRMLQTSTAVALAGVAQPAPPPPPEPEPEPEPVVGVGVSSCGVFDVSACVGEAFTAMLRTAVVEVVNPALELLSNTLLQTPQPTAVPRLAALWGMSWQIAVAVYGVVVVVAGLVVMAHQSVQARYGVREIGPRLLLGFVAGWVTLPLADMAVQVANAVSGRLVGGVDERAGMAGLAALVRSSVASPPPVVGVAPWPLLLAGLVVGLLLVGVLVGYLVRVVAVIVLVAAGPVVVMWHALPQTDPVARWWWRALGGLLSIQVIQALIIAVGLAVILPDPARPGRDSPAAVLGLPGDGAGWVTLLVVGVLLWVLVRVPGWVWAQVKVSAGGRSTVTRLVTAALLYKTGGLLRGAIAGTATRPPGRRGPPRGPGDPTHGAGVDPYAAAPVEANGQWQIPFGPLRRRRPAATQQPWTPPRGADGAPRRGPGQTALPLAEGLWPEDRPVATRGGQWRLPIPATPVPHPPTPPNPPARGPMRAGQMQFPGYRGRTGLRAAGPVEPRRWYWPENRPPPGAPEPGVQQALISARRVPPAAPPPSVRAVRETQLALDLPPVQPYQHRLRFTDPRRPLPERPVPFTAPALTPTRPRPTTPHPTPGPNPSGGRR